MTVQNSQIFAAKDFDEADVGSGFWSYPKKLVVWRAFTLTVCCRKNCDDDVIADLCQIVLYVVSKI